ncbi:hypothetical protein FOZ63_013681 [Perkinsus olseni]|uniref:Uncharacterized protein n=1 Tax=Perkinsus olseni TaxID=32597 RepID=A0A7J6TKM8_PEROL|nr:hypothetical protein FOZ63_013681 [Perkinsus olseni]KAF4745884.1 hypothetical protein FOZ62_013955 [Perkinsus olseni]
MRQRAAGRRIPLESIPSYPGMLHIRCGVLQPSPIATGLGRAAAVFSSSVMTSIAPIPTNMTPKPSTFSSTFMWAFGIHK